MIREEYLLNSQNYKYVPYQDGRQKEGFSGKLLVGTHKKSGQRILVKHSDMSDVANEFVGHYLSDLLGLNNPKACIIMSERKPQRFKTKYAVGIEFLDNLQPLPSFGNNYELAKTVIKQIALQRMILQSDTYQLSWVDDHSISVDFAEAFEMTEVAMRISERFGTELLSNNLNSFIEGQRINEKWILEFGIEYLRLPDTTEVRNWILDSFYSVYEKASLITDQDITDLCDTLQLLYSPLISNYYGRCLNAIRKYSGKICEGSIK